MAESGGIAGSEIAAALALGSPLEIFRLPPIEARTPTAITWHAGTLSGLAHPRTWLKRVGKIVQIPNELLSAVGPKIIS